MAMKTCKWMTAMMLCAGFSLSACTSDDGLSSPSETGQGQLMLNLVSGTKFTEDTRAVNENDYKITDKYTVVVIDANNIEKLNCLGSEVASKMPLTMPIGSYTIKAFYGTETHASRNSFYVYGETQGSIKAEQKESVEVNCTPTCGRITVNFDEGMSTYFSDYKVTFKGTEALGETDIDWNKDDTEPWYVKLKGGTEGEEITFTITTTTKNEYIDKTQEATKTGKFTLKRNYAYKMNVNVTYNPTTQGDLKITVTIDESTNDKPVDIEVPVDWI